MDISNSTAARFLLVTLLVTLFVPSPLALRSAAREQPLALRQPMPIIRFGLKASRVPRAIRGAQPIPAA
jgi:hypothetical protein